MWSLKLLTIIIQASPRFQMIYTLLLFQTTKVFCGDTFNILESTFGYDFNTIPAIGTVLIWRISGNYNKFQPLQYNGQDFHFGSEETYLLLTQKLPKMYMVYYWLGKNASLIDKKVAAKHAVLLSQLPEIIRKHEFEWLNIVREIEGMESDSFLHTMKMLNRQASPRQLFDMFAKYLDEILPSPQPNLYVVHGGNHSRFKKIPLSLGLQWLVKKDICFVLEVDHKVKGMAPINYLYNEDANINHIIRLWSFVDIFPIYSTPEGIFSQKIENDRDSGSFKQFLEVLEDSKFYNPNEVDHSDDHWKDGTEFVIHRDREISLFDVTSSGLKEIRRRPIRTSLFEDNRMGHLLDTKSVAGAILEFSELKDIYEKIKSIELTEEYLHETYPLSSGQIIKLRIIGSHTNKYIPDFILNFSDFPRRQNLPDDQLW